VPRIVIDQDKCLHSGQCGYLQPELFEINDDGSPTVLVETLEDEGLIARAREAMEMCPSQAISLED
jgi:ferredoxin